MTAGRCAHCPRAGLATCQGEAVPRLCQLVDPSHPAYRPEYLSALGSEAPPDDGPKPPGDLAHRLRIMRLARDCPHRSTSPACGCVKCGMRGGASVSPVECWACVERRGG